MTQNNGNKHENRLTGWHFVAGALCPRCRAQDTLKFHFTDMVMHCVECNLRASEDEIKKLDESTQESKQIDPDTQILQID